MNKIALWSYRSSSADPVHHIRKTPHSSFTKPASPSISCRQQAIPRFSHPSIGLTLLDEEFNKPSHFDASSSDSSNNGCCHLSKNDHSISSEYDSQVETLGNNCLTVPDFINVITIVNVIKNLNDDFFRAENIVLDTRENRLYQTEHIKHSYSASCHTKTMAKRSIAFWISTYPRQQGGKSVYIYDLKSSKQLGVQNAHLLFFIQYLQNQGNKIYILDGGWLKFKELYGKDSDLWESSMEKELVDRYTFSPTNRESASEDVLNATASAINEFLWLGNERDAHDWELLQRNGISHVLNVTNDVPNYFEHKRSMTYHRLAASDSQSQDLFKFFDEAYQFIEKARSDAGHVLVHCWAGVSRSATIVISYVMRSQNIDLPCALEQVRCKRRIVAPNFNFMGQLERFYNTILKKSIQVVVEEYLVHADDDDNSDNNTPMNKDTESSMDWLEEANLSKKNSKIKITSLMPSITDCKINVCSTNKSKTSIGSCKNKKGLIACGGGRIKLLIPKSAPPPAFDIHLSPNVNGFVFNNAV